jgi:hypothetical protein
VSGAGESVTSWLPDTSWRCRRAPPPCGSPICPAQRLSLGLAVRALRLRHRRSKPPHTYDVRPKPKDGCAGSAFRPMVPVSWVSVLHDFPFVSSPPSTPSVVCVFILESTEPDIGGKIDEGQASSEEAIEDARHRRRHLGLRLVGPYGRKCFGMARF